VGDEVKRVGSAAGLAERLLEVVRDETYRPLEQAELMRALALPADQSPAFATLLEGLEADGLVVRTDAGRIGAPERMDLVVGRLSGHPRGFGFVVPVRPEFKDVHIGAEAMHGAMHGDRVVARVDSGPDEAHPDGEIVRILARANLRVVGDLKEQDGLTYVTPDERRLAQDILVPEGETGDAAVGDKVVLEITRFPDDRTGPVGRVVERIGRTGDPGVDIEAIIRRHDLPRDFPEEVLAEAAAIPDHVLPQEHQGRLDLRDLPMVTIDSEDTKDIDDAVSVERLPDGAYRLGVHIADVSHYVREGTALDREAATRATSVYLVDRVIPMLPPSLSNGICSLNPKVERLAMSVFVEVDGDGRRHGYRLAPSVIRTRERMTYTAVNRILDGDPEALERYAHVSDMIQAMRELMAILRRERERRGSIDFDLKDAKVILDANGHPVDVVRVERTVADQIIEEFMLVANEAVSEDFTRRNVPFLYRVHEEPDPERLATLNEFLFHFGYSIPLKNQKFHPRLLQGLLTKVAGRPEEHLISTVVLRSLRRARYAAESLGHFGLAAVYYSHFTSPIRRYPDLQIHRIIREALEGRLTAERQEHYRRILPGVAEVSTERERGAEEAERESVDRKKIEFMADRVGEDFSGLISGVASFGFFVELENTVEGLCRISSLLDDYYHYHESQYALIGQRTGRVLRLGDPVKVRVMRVDPDQGQMDFVLTEFAEAMLRRGPGGRGVSRPYTPRPAASPAPPAPTETRRVEARPAVVPPAARQATVRTASAAALPARPAAAAPPRTLAQTAPVQGAAADGRRRRRRRHRGGS
jgi:ribonuclease R